MWIFSACEWSIPCVSSRWDSAGGRSTGAVPTRSSSPFTPVARKCLMSAVFKISEPCMCPDSPSSDFGTCAKRFEILSRLPGLLACQKPGTPKRLASYEAAQTTDRLPHRTRSEKIHRRPCLCSPERSPGDVCATTSYWNLKSFLIFNALSLRSRLDGATPRLSAALTVRKPGPLDPANAASRISRSLRSPF